MGQLEGRIVWITGSAKRVGRAIAEACAREGADIVVHCRISRYEAEETAGRIRGLGREALIVEGDHGIPSDAERMAREIEAAFGRLDALVNSAAVFPRKPFAETTQEDFDKAIDANLRGPFLCAQAALPLLRKAAPPAHLINITDASLSTTYPNASAYWCSKGGLDALTKALATELAPGILVNAIAPGPIIPPPHYNEDQKAASVRRTLLQRWGSPDDVARAAVFLLTSNYVTGETVKVDGGRSLG